MDELRLEALASNLMYHRALDREPPNCQSPMFLRFYPSPRFSSAVYFEYAGEDTSTSSDVRLGNVGLSAGLRFPQVGPWNLDLTFEGQRVAERLVCAPHLS